MEKGNALERDIINAHLALQAKWLTENYDPFRRICNHSGVAPLPAKEAAIEMEKVLVDLAGLRLYELIMVILTLNWSIVGEGILHYLLKILEVPAQADEIEKVAAEVISQINRQLSKKDREHTF